MEDKKQEITEKVYKALAIALTTDKILYTPVPKQVN